jgi:hypothetical protein
MDTILIWGSQKRLDYNQLIDSEPSFCLIEPFHDFSSFNTLNGLPHMSNSRIFWVQNMTYKKKTKVRYLLRVKCLVRYSGKLRNWRHNKRALSPIFATVLLASIILVFGSVAYYYSANLTNAATNNYVNKVSNSQQSMSERIGFENVVYHSSTSPATLTVYMINSGSANNLQVDSVFLYLTASHSLVGQPYQGSVRTSAGPIFALYSIDNGATIQSNSLNIGNEGYFTVPLSGALQSGTSYTIHVITQSGSSFDYEFTP